MEGPHEGRNEVRRWVLVWREGDEAAGAHRGRGLRDREKLRGLGFDSLIGLSLYRLKPAR